MNLKNLKQPTILALLGSILLSTWVWIGGTTINTDGVIYLNAADAFLSQGFSASVRVYGWPFYSVLIACVTKLGFSLDSAAHLLNLLLFAVLSFTFVKITEVLYPHERAAHFLAVLVVLLFPRLNFLRASFFRDAGFLTCILLSLLAMLYFLRNARKIHFIAWLAMVLCASLFRSEAIVLLGAGALVFLYSSKITRHQKITALVAALLTAVTLIYVSQPLLTTHLPPFWNQLTSDFRNEFNASANALADSVLNEFSRDYRRDGLLAVLLTILVGTIIKHLTPIYVLTFWATRKTSTGISSIDLRLLYIYCVLLILPPAIFVLKTHFITSRYVMGFLVVVLLTIPLKLTQVAGKIPKKSIFIATSTVVFLFFCITSMKELAVETLQKEAGLWLAQRNGSIWTNKLPVSYYAANARQTRSVDVIHNGAWPKAPELVQQYNWIAIAAKESQSDDITSYIESIHGQEVKRFKDHERLVVIIKTSPRGDK